MFFDYLLCIFLRLVHFFFEESCDFFFRVHGSKCHVIFLSIFTAPCKKEKDVIHGNFGNLPRSNPWNMRAECASPSAVPLAWFSHDYHWNVTVVVSTHKKYVCHENGKSWSLMKKLSMTHLCSLHLQQTVKFWHKGMNRTMSKLHSSEKWTLEGIKNAEGNEDLRKAVLPSKGYRH